MREALREVLREVLRIEESPGGSADLPPLPGGSLFTWVLSSVLRFPWRAGTRRVPLGETPGADWEHRREPAGSTAGSPLGAPPGTRWERRREPAGSTAGNPLDATLEHLWEHLSGCR